MEQHSRQGHALWAAVIGLVACAAVVFGLSVVQTPASMQAPEIQIHTFTSSARGYDANAYWLESREGLVLIDALMLRSDARGLVAAMKVTGKPLAGILVTHPHLDHLAGISTVRAAFGDVLVFATKATSDGIAPTWKRALADGWPQAHGGDFDLVPPTPDKIVEPGAALTLAGMMFRMHDYGAMEAENNSVIHQVDRNVLFTGDMTVSHAPFYVGEGRSAAAIDALTKLTTDFPTVRMAYSGHYGAMALAPLVANNIADIKHYRALVTAYMLMSDSSEHGLTADSRSAAIAALADRLSDGPTYGLPPRAMAQMNVAALETELGRELNTRKLQPETITAIKALAPVMGLIGRWRGALGDQSVDMTFALNDGGTTISGHTAIRTMNVRFALSYDVYQHRYRMTAIDDITGLIDVFTGNLDAQGALVLSNVESGTSYLAKGKPMHTQLTLQMRLGGGWSLRTAESADRGETWTPRLDFTTSRRLGG